jgi:hypothetical protein
VTSDSLVLLAGFAIAHAAWSVSDLPQGELLVPLAFVEKNGQRQLLRFEAKTQDQAIAEAKAALTQRQPELDAWACVALRPDDWSRSGTRASGNIRRLDGCGRAGVSREA